MLTVDQAMQLVAQHAVPLAPSRVKLRDALGLVLAEPIVSDIDSPPHNKAMMDGFAVVASDRTTTRTIIEDVMAGDVPRRAVRPGGASRVMTGAPVPDGATAVVPVEKTRLIDDRTVRLEWVDPPVGKHIMRQGSSLHVGQQVAAAGAAVHSIAMAALAEVGSAVVKVIPQPRVSVLATGNELVSVDQKPSPGHIRNSNGPLLVALVTEAGGVAHELPVGRDDPDELRSLIARGLASDVLLVTGGVSAGMKDLVPEALVAVGVQQVFHKLSLKPGKPLWFGIVPRSAGPPTLVFGLPGNPVSGLVCFHLFVKPALAVLAGRLSSVRLELLRGRAAGKFVHRGGRETFRPVRVLYRGSLSLADVEFFDWHGSADIAGTLPANGLVRLPSQPVTVAAGDEMDFLPLRTT
jgi:molybdopterin molybdotransferase